MGIQDLRTPLLAFLGLVMLLIQLLRGRMITPGPTCSRGEYDLQNMTSNSCPECGADHAVTGVFMAGRQPSPHGMRTLTLGLIALILYPVCVNLTAPLARLIAKRINPNNTGDSG